jgi:hypothetical protein
MGDRYTIGGPLFLGFVFNPLVITIECEQIESEVHSLM